MRNYVITGSASGIGGAVRHLLESQGHRVIGVDLQGAEVTVDLSTPEGRGALAPAVKEHLGGEGIHGIVASAGLAAPRPLTVAVNYYGAVATLEDLRALLIPDEGRAVAVASASAVLGVSNRLVEACLNGTEEEALRIAGELVDAPGNVIYSSSKRAIARYVRRRAASDDWAGRGIPLNAVAPGVTETAMVAQYRESDPAAYERLRGSAPMPLGGFSQPEDIAQAILFLISPENRKMTGQTLYVDAGSEVVTRGEDVWTALDADHA